MLIIFDFDGVIADSLHLAVKTINRMLVMEGQYNLVKEQDIRKLGIKQLIKRYKVPIHKVPLYIHRSRKIIGEEIHRIKPFSGIKRTLTTLRKENSLAIVTSNSKENVEIFLKANRMENLFDPIIAGTHIFGKKGALKKAVKNANAAKSVLIGDEVRDIEAARKAGIKVIAVEWGYNSAALLKKQKPDGIAKKPKHIMSLVKQV